MNLRAYAAVCCLLGGTAFAQDYPSRPIRLVVGFAPGGGADVAARLVAQKLQESWNATVVVDNRAGAGGNLAAEIVAKSNPDGYTLLVTSPGPVAINPSLLAKLPYDPAKELAPLTLLAFGPNVLVVHPTSTANSVKDFIALARNASTPLNYGTSGIGSTPHLSAELFKNMAKVNMTHVPYKGAGAAAIDLVAGRIDVMIVSAPTVLTQVKAGRLKALGVTSPKRAAVLPDVPTLNEAGLPGYEAGVWWGMLAPAGTPAPVIDKINKSVVAILETQDVKTRIANEGAEASPMTPRAFGDFLKKETVKWAGVIKAANIKAD
jgi:tripartite-type tricarboxylate transporter receptor subunit TctC